MKPYWFSGIASATPSKLPSTNFKESPTLSATLVGTFPINDPCRFVLAVPEVDAFCAKKTDMQAATINTIRVFIHPPGESSSRELGRFRSRFGSNNGGPG